MQTDQHTDSGWELRRRAVLSFASALAASHVVPHALAQALPADAAPTPSHASTQRTVNGKRHTVAADTRTTLLDALREHRLLTGTHGGCDHGQCGAFAVLVEGRRVNACLSLVVMHDGQAATPIEGLAKATYCIRSSRHSFCATACSAATVSRARSARLSACSRRSG